MKRIAIAGLCLELLATGCATRSHTSSSQWPAPRSYLEDELALTLTQEGRSFDLVLALQNRSSHPITNRFAESRFEGVIWIVQEDAVPFQTYPSNYFNLVIHALWTNPLIVIPPGEELTYRIPLDSLLSTFSSRHPDLKKPAFAYAFLHKFEALSNTIRLEKPERIQWRTSAVQRPGASRSAQETNRTSSSAGSRR